MYIYLAIRLRKYDPVKNDLKTKRIDNGNKGARRTETKQKNEQNVV